MRIMVQLSCMYVRQAQAAQKLVIIAQSLSERTRGHLLASDKRPLGLHPIGACGPLGIPLPCPHVPLFLEKEEHAHVWGAPLKSSWLSKYVVACGARLSLGSLVPALQLVSSRSASVRHMLWLHGRPVVSAWSFVP